MTAVVLSFLFPRRYFVYDCDFFTGITTENSYLTITNVSVGGGGDKNIDQYTGTL
jgi:hypothetical protein